MLLKDVWTTSGMNMSGLHVVAVYVRRERCGREERDVDFLSPLKVRHRRLRLLHARLSLAPWQGPTRL